MVHVCMNTQAHTPRNAHVHMHIIIIILGLVQSLYRACSWLVHVQGILQASVVSKCITYRTWVWIIFLLQFINNIYYRQVEKIPLYNHLPTPVDT